MKRSIFLMLVELTGLWMLLAFVLPASASWKEQVLYSFQGGSDGAVPAGGVVFDKQGNLYGATTYGNQYGELGVVYELSPPAKKGGPWTESLIYSFLGKTGYNDGMNPEGGLIIDSSGNLYGTTAYGGAGGCILLGVLYGCGTVYELSAPQHKGDPWTEIILYSFQSGSDGYFPWGNLTFDKAGNLYGATSFGGGNGNACNAYYGGNCGTVFKLSPPKQNGGQWTEQVLHSFAGIANGQQTGDGANPNGGLALDRKGAIYGTTYAGGNGAGPCGAAGCGTAFVLKPPARRGAAWTENMLHVFTNYSDGALPRTGLVFGSDGKLYGTTLGSIFSLEPRPKKSGSWKKVNLYGFCNQNGGGCEPEGNLIFDSSGNFYGTTYYGFGSEQRGSIFRLKAPRRNGGSWTIDYLHGFLNAPDGLFPAANVVFDKRGNLYSTTQGGGTGDSCQNYCGTVFEVSP